MKPNEYIKKYNLKIKDTNFNHNEFIADLAIDFNAMIEYHRNANWNYPKFQLCVKDIRQKFVSISSKTAHKNINDKMWGYFYATIVGPAKESMFGEQLKREREIREERKREKQRWNRAQQAWQNIWEEQYRRVIDSLLKGISAIPTGSFITLGISESASQDEIKKKYKELAFECHPDRNQSDPKAARKFRDITEARDRCLAYAS
jgi:curved DNA-binding protein CbpA